MRSASHSPDRLDVIFDDDRAVADAGLVLPATLAARDWDSARFEADEITKLLNAYEARGWQYVETVTPHTGGPVTVFRRRLR